MECTENRHWQFQFFSKHAKDERDVCYMISKTKISPEIDFFSPGWFPKKYFFENDCLEDFNIFF